MKMFALIMPSEDGMKVFHVQEEPAPIPWLEGAVAGSRRNGVEITCLKNEKQALKAGQALSINGKTISCVQMDGQAYCLGPDLVTVDEKMLKLFHLCILAARVREPVLILGESGVGKEVIAKTLHLLATGKMSRFVAINMGAIPDGLAESELFGCVKGAYTGADMDRAGAFETAKHGTLFLDEVCETSLPIQAKLLRAVEERQVQRLGSPKKIGVSSRIISATNRDIWTQIEQGFFRQDLYERLSCVVIKCPPLRERKCDIPFLARRLLDMCSKTPAIEKNALKALQSYPWLGNVRELKNCLSRATMLCMDGIITEEIIREAMALNPYQDWGRVACTHYTVGRAQQIRESGLKRSTFYYRLKKREMMGGIMS
jgi:DNA-binding NtrC family response regulator